MVCTLTLPRISFQPILLNLWKHLWWWWCDCAAVCPSTTDEAAQTLYICMSHIWDAVWKVLQPQPYNITMVCTLATAWVSAKKIFTKPGQTSVVLMVWVWLCSNMPILNRWRCSNTFNVGYGFGMQFARFYNLNHSSVNRNVKVHVMGLISKLSGECVCLPCPWLTMHSKGEAGYFDPLDTPGLKVVCLVWDFSSWWPEVGIGRRPTAVGRALRQLINLGEGKV